MPSIAQHEKLLGSVEVHRPETTLPGMLLQPARILVVDDEDIVRDVLLRKLIGLGYSCEGCSNGRQALELLESRPFDLIVSDLVMPEVGGVTLLREVKSRWPDTAVILATSIDDLHVAVDAIKDGAYDYLSKPFSLEEVSIAVARALESRRLQIENREYRKSLEDQVTSRTRQLQDAMEILRHTYQSTLVALATALDSRDADSDGHTLRVTLFTLRLARQMGLSEQELHVLEQGALLHDIGKIGIPDRVLNKPGRLSDDEWELMRKHPEIGYRIVSGISFLRGGSEIVLQHQERYDGGGYPRGLKGDEICLGARIFAVADTLDGMTSSKPFQDAIPFEEAREAIRRAAGTRFDPAVVDVFLQIPVEEWQAIRREVAASPVVRARIIE